jgi:hypothetical protein
MENRRLATSSLGETGLEITRVGFGARVIGGSGCSRSVRAAAVRLSGPGPVSGIRLARWGAPRLAAVLIVITRLAGCEGAGPPRDLRLRARRPDHPRPAGGPTAGAGPCSAQR